VIEDTSLDFDQVADRLAEVAATLGSDSRRIFHGRGRSFSGLDFISVDWFEPAILVTLFEDIGSESEQKLVDVIRTGVHQCKVIYLQRRFRSAPRFELVWGSPVDKLVAKRGDLRFKLNLHQQNVGYFLDIEPARLWLQEKCPGKRVLNLFAFTCSFSLVASRHQAASVLNMDLSSKSLAVGRENYRENDISTDGIQFYANDILKSWGRIRRYGPYDLIVIDPPSFQKGSFVASKDYARVLSRIHSFSSDAARVLVCLNAPEVLYQDFLSNVLSYLEGFCFERRLEPHPDFPDAEPNRALKMAVFRKP